MNEASTIKQHPDRCVALLSDRFVRPLLAASHPSLVALVEQVGVRGQQQVHGAGEPLASGQVQRCQALEVAVQQRTAADEQLHDTRVACRGQVRSGQVRSQKSGQRWGEVRTGRSGQRTGLGISRNSRISRNIGLACSRR